MQTAEESASFTIQWSKIIACLVDRKLKILHCDFEKRKICGNCDIT